jgi:uncharacterized membrane protein YheB (UPF0754 family)
VGFRRLPSWIKSRFLFEVKRSPNLPHDPNSLIKGFFLERSGFRNHADKVIERYIPRNLRKTHSNIYYLRKEFFADDFKEIFGKYLDVTKISDSELETKINPSTMNESIDELISQNLDLIYKSCPVWAELESIIY